MGERAGVRKRKPKWYIGNNKRSNRLGRIRGAKDMTKRRGKKSIQRE